MKNSNQFGIQQFIDATKSLSNSALCFSDGFFWTESPDSNPGIFVCSYSEFIESIKSYLDWHGALIDNALFQLDVESGSYTLNLYNACATWERHLMMVLGCPIEYFDDSIKTGNHSIEIDGVVFWAVKTDKWNTVYMDSPFFNETTSPSRDDIKKGARATGLNVRFGRALFLSCSRSYHTDAPYPVPGCYDWQELRDRAEWVSDAINAYIAAGHQPPIPGFDLTFSAEK